LRDHQRNIKETHTTGLSQIDMMTDLVKMLTAKLELMKNPYASLGAMDGGEAGMEGMGGPGMASGEYKTPTANVFVM
jgi:intraflagellar transport protein 81